MNLPKRFKIILHVLLFCTVIFAGNVFAQNMPKKEVATPSSSVQHNQDVTLPPNADANYLPLPNGTEKADTSLPTGEANIQTAGCGLPFTVPVVGGICNSIKAVIDKLGDCGGNIPCYVGGAVEVVQRKVLDQATGCGNMDTPVGYQDCEQKYLALINGGSIADVQDPGALFMVASVADSGLKLNIPITTDQYLATINPFTAKTANAQAADELNKGGLNTLWLNFRNTAFAFSAIILVIIGFMIMLRSRLDPRTSITAMNSLPKVVIAMVLIYFSFGLAGFMLDLGRLTLQLVYRTVPLSAGSIGSGLVELLLLILLAAAGPFVSGAIGGLTGGTSGLVTGVAKSLLVGPLLLLLLILGIFLLIVILNLLFKLVQRYAQFIIYTLFAPFFFLWGALPGQSSFGWFKSQLANVISIPAMLLIIRLATFIVFNTSGLGGKDSFSLPSPFASGIGSASGVSDVFWIIISPLIGLALLFYATKMPAIIDGLFGIKDYGARAGIGPGVIFAPIGAGANLGKAFGGLATLGQTYTRLGLPGSGALNNRLGALWERNGGSGGNRNDEPPSGSAEGARPPGGGGGSGGGGRPFGGRDAHDTAQNIDTHLRDMTNGEGGDAGTAGGPVGSTQSRGRLSRLVRGAAGYAVGGVPGAVIGSRNPKQSPPKTNITSTNKPLDAGFTPEQSSDLQKLKDKYTKNPDKF